MVQFNKNVTEDKKTWGPGPWQKEPDLAEFEEHGLKCRIRRGPVGALCGYVGVPVGHPGYGASYNGPNDYYSLDENTIWWRRYINKIPEYAIAGIEVHGGLTYGSDEKDGYYWFGFDCAHAGDLCPQIVAMTGDAHGDTYKDFHYVTEEVKSLAKQLAAIK